MAISNAFTARASGLAVALALLHPSIALAQAKVTPDGAATPSDSPAADSEPQTGDAAAQQAVSQDIVVTGTRIRGVAPVGSALTTLDADAIANSGRVTIDRAIKELPQVFDLGVSENSRAQSGGSGNIVYGNSINLRGIGPNATLILVDGHRVTNNSRSIDPSVLPTLGVERVEIIADGASAIYGSDAVAGVVNLIPRRNLNGVEAYGRAGWSDDGQYHELSGGIAAGKKFDWGQVMVAYEHVEKSDLNGFDRPFFTSYQTPFGGNDYRVMRCNPGTIRQTSGSTTVNTWAIPTGGVTPANASTLVRGSANLCDDLQGQDLIPSQRYDSVNGTATFHVNDWLTFFADGFYSYRWFERLPAFASASLTVPSTNAWFVVPAGVTLAQLPACPASAGAVAGSKCLTVDYNFRQDVARNVSFGHGESWQITPGVRVKLPHDWQFEALVGKGETNDNSSSLLGTNNTALAAALRSSNPATAFDPWGLNRTDPAVIAGIFNQISINPTVGHFLGYEARLNGPLFRLPGGEVKMALGYEGQEFSVDLGLARGNPGTPITYTTHGRRVDSGYAQVIVPVFSAENATPGFQELTIDAAVRYDKYSDVGDTTNPKIGVNWRPLPGLLLRGSYGTSFRAPTLPQLYGNTNQLFVQSYQNPTGGAPITGIARSGGNLGLKPETATTYSFGADFDPVRNLRLSATYFSVDYENQVIALLSDLSVLTRLSQYNGTGLVIYDTTGVAPAAAVTAALAAGVAQPTGTIPQTLTVYVDGRSQNLGASITRGIDFQANYRIPTAHIGTFTANLSGTYLLGYHTKQTPTAPFIDQLNQIFQPLRLKMRASLTWDIDPFSASVRVTRINGYLNNAVTPNQNVGAYTPVDLDFTWRFGRDTKLPIQMGLELRNVFDEKPPYVNIAPSVNGSGGYDATATDPIGRLIAVSARVKW